ncbi:uncharacterized protein B0H18DRAFT_439228 [Fomitopsis serialis]|uniref:uncharacterized protein n=1 Tax=Fomitopsis serialis TaxID=139415 RepID=UPI002007CFD4|nr:uncharacterized protein B0H18DRAFT_439136 [Neoantrodia serialis]XP_047892408.1 uncharacterized protein B0H18DRAFT_439228 [Neoantrodia serialis]KAH9924218.1 hypothetical protein B0H18DRAFT_439136 [Neoantrodia serialis]KAH9924220.1 hypothetical protein B0H18DRAFT_439228 [Neoantrodia serialis]
MCYARLPSRRPRPDAHCLVRVSNTPHCLRLWTRSAPAARLSSPISRALDARTNPPYRANTTRHAENDGDVHGADVPDDDARTGRGRPVSRRETRRSLGRDRLDCKGIRARRELASGEDASRRATKDTCRQIEDASSTDARLSRSGPAIRARRSATQETAYKRARCELRSELGRDTYHEECRRPRVHARTCGKDVCALGIAAVGRRAR